MLYSAILFISIGAFISLLKPEHRVPAVIVAILMLLEITRRTGVHF